MNNTMRILLVVLFFIVVIASNPGYAQVQDQPFHCSDLIKEALENNPELQSFHNAYNASVTRIPQAGAYPDPTFNFNLANIPINTFDFNQEPMTGKVFSISQMIPFPGKLGLARDIAQQDARIAKSDYDEISNQLVKDIKVLYYELAYTDKATVIIEKNKSLMEELTKITETHYRVGHGLQHDVLKAQLELSRMIERLIGIQQKRVEISAQINALLNRDSESFVGHPDELEFIPVEYNLAQLKSLANENRPVLKAWVTTVDQSAKKVSLAKKEYYPDFGIGLAYIQRDVLILVVQIFFRACFR